MKSKFINLFADIATRTAEMSSAIRLKVGAIIVKDDRIISMGYNGMPAGWSNICEDEIVDMEDGNITLKTKSEVLHAEMNALMKLARSTESGDGASMFLTHSPCMECAKGIYQAGIKEIYYKTQYRSNDGLDFLKKCNITVIKI